MTILPVTFGISYKSKPKTSVLDKEQKPLYKESEIKRTLKTSVPAAIIALAPFVGVFNSCTMDNRTDAVEVSWIEVASGRLSDSVVDEINESRQTPKNTLIKKVDETETEYYTDDEGETRSREVKTGGWHYELVNNSLGLETGTTRLPDGYVLRKNKLGFLTVVPEGTKSIFLRKDKNEENKIKESDSIENEISFIQAQTNILTDEQIDKINKTGVVPKGTIIETTKDGRFVLTSDVSGLSTGTRLMPEGYEMRKNVAGIAQIVPIDTKSVFLRNNKNTDSLNDTIKNDINFLEAQSRLLSDRQISIINKTKKMPDGTIIEKDKYGNYYITSDITGLSTGTKTLPKGYEVRKDITGFAIVVLIDQKGVFIRDK